MAFIGTPALQSVNIAGNPVMATVAPKSDMSSSWFGGSIKVTPLQNWSLDNLLNGTTPDAATSPANQGTTEGSLKNVAGGVGGYISDLFLRGTIIILGFIFIAVGLSMFKGVK